MLVVLLFFAPPCFAKAKGFCFVVGYSYKLKKLYFTPIFTVKVRNVSYSATEYVAEMDLIQKMESQFQQHLRNASGVNPADYTVASRGAYKSKSLAVKSLEKEKKEYANKGFELLDLKNFQFK